MKNHIMRYGNLPAACLTSAVLLTLFIISPHRCWADSGTKSGASGGITWVATLEGALEQARAERKYVMVDFYTAWCGWCRRLERQTYSDPDVVKRVSRMVAVRVDGEREKAITAGFGVRAFPTVLFLNPDGTLKHRIRGFKAPTAFVGALDLVSSSDSEQFALETRVRFEPENYVARLELAELLALRNEHLLAAAHLDTLLRTEWGSSETKPGLELDRIRFLVQAGDTKGVDRELERWLSRNKTHDRRAEAIYISAELHERKGRIKDARKSYLHVVESAPRSWIAELAAARLSALSSR